MTRVPSPTSATSSGPEVVIVGAGGQLGTALLATRPSSAAVRGLTSAHLDITDRQEVQRIIGALGRDDVVINCAAYTNVDAAESDAARAAVVNRDGAASIACATAASGAHLIHVSTDYVFAGGAGAAEIARRRQPYEPDDVTGEPESVYGATKLAGELAVLAADPHATVVRTAWVYTGGGASPDFVGTMRRFEATRDEIKVVDDQTGSPTYALDLASGIWEMTRPAVRDSTTGRTLHATNAGCVTWYQVARAVFEELGADPARVRPCTTLEFPRPAPRPEYSVLSGAAWKSVGLTPLRDWRTALHVAVAAST